MLTALALIGCGSPTPDPLAVLRADDQRLAAQVEALAEIEPELQTPPAAAPAAPTQTVGVTIEMGVAVLDLLDRHYVAPIDWPSLAAAGHRAVGAALAEVRTREDAARQLQALAAESSTPGEVVVPWIEGALRSLDPHTAAIWPAQVAGWEAHHEGVYVGVGVDLADDDGVRVRWPVPGSPAFEAGVHQDDRILAVGGEPVSTADQAAMRLRGEEGTAVAVRLARGDEVLELTLDRRAITPETVLGWQRAADNRWDPWLDREAGIAYARVVGFRPHTDEALDLLLEPVVGEARAIVLDLRGCPGGDLDAAAQLADRFVAAGKVVQLQGRELPPPPPEGVVAWNEAVEGHPLEGLPVAVLVDAYTASSAEVVAGALDVLADAILVGSTTFGKGSSQILVPVPELGFAVQVTNLRWVLPDGRSLEGTGVGPDESIPLGLVGTYQVDLMRRRLEHVRSHADGSTLRVDLPSPREDLPVLEADPHVVRAVLRLRERLAP